MENQKQEELYVREVLNINMIKELLGVNLVEYEDTIWSPELTIEQEEIITRILEYITKKLIVSGGCNSREGSINYYLKNIFDTDIKTIIDQI